MIHDPIVEEVRRIRRDYAERFDYDPAAIAEDLKRSGRITRNGWFPSRPNRRAARTWPEGNALANATLTPVIYPGCQLRRIYGLVAYPSRCSQWAISMAQ